MQGAPDNGRVWIAGAVTYCTALVHLIYDVSQGRDLPRWGGGSSAEVAKRVRGPDWERWVRLLPDHRILVFPQESYLVQRFFPSDFSLRKGWIAHRLSPPLPELPELAKGKRAAC